MKRINLFFLFIITTLFACENTNQNTTSAEVVAEEKEHPNITKLKAQSNEFKKELIQLGERVYMGVGYDGSNAAMIVGDDGLVIIDGLRGVGAAEELLADFRKISDKPIKALIYTHGHGDHTGGASAFIKDPSQTRIIARAHFKEELEGNSPVKKILIKRNIRQFGRDLPDKDIVNRGVAAGRTPTDRAGKGYVPPNETFEESLSLTIAGIDIELRAANGETNDELFVWLPKDKTLFTGDNYYKAFPNLYAIRGSQYRDVKSWGESIHRMSQLPVEHLVPGHTRPLSGKDEIHKNLTNYSEAILSVYNQTIDGMNQGLSVEELCAKVQLPAHLKEADNLQEFYGSVPWGVRSIFFHLVGWFDGNPSQLYPLTPKAEATQIVRLAGGKDKIKEQFQQAIKEKEYQWGMQLADYLLALDNNNAEAKQMKILALRKSAATQINAPARNYYLSYAMEMEE